LFQYRRLNNFKLKVQKLLVLVLVPLVF